MFNALWTSAKDKRHNVYPSGHVEFIDRQEVVQQGLDWMDCYLVAGQEVASHAPQLHLSRPRATVP